MINEEKYSNALFTLHRIFVKARHMAYKNEDYALIARLLDYAEILPEMISAEDDKTEVFEESVKAIAASIPDCGIIIQAWKTDLSNK